MKTVILTHADADGICAGSILLSAHPKSQIFFTKPVSLLKDLQEIRADRYLISDIAINKKDAPELVNLIKEKGAVEYFDQHPIPDNITKEQMAAACEKFVHELGVSTSEIVYKHFQKEIPRERIWPALYGAIADYEEDTPFVQERLRNWDIRAIYFEVSTLVLGIKMEGFDTYDAKRGIVMTLARGGNPSDVFGLVSAAKNAVSMEFDLYKLVKQRAKTSGRIGYVKAVPFGFRGAAALFAATITNTPIGMCIFERKGRHLDITIRGRDSGVKLHKLAEDAAAEVGGSGGGLPDAAGARIPLGALDRFLKRMNELILLSQTQRYPRSQKV